MTLCSVEHLEFQKTTIFELAVYMYNTFLMVTVIGIFVLALRHSLVSDNVYT
jgi:hypothetical protein